MICRQKGFNLIEVLISFLLIGIGALGLIKLQTYVEQKSDFAIQSVEALHLAENKLEGFRTRGASAALSSITPTDFITDIVDGEDHTHVKYQLDWTVTSRLSGALKTIQMTSSWQDRFGEDQSITLDTMISKYSEFD
ncbi:MAG: type IV pilus modification PilV family protein [Vibrio toranzoniae]|jgi:type IV pilus assembly protein PilV|uniref:type IV pilus modification PilV family protein n=1 Tax=Vibrio toranzoniae TaxID=1194427 RepID=UPI001377723D|nr:prepilin-type N-terminal cleavage/methylation domain-containing protein [Vibrio toranzoniae]NAZ45851.1 prepilin-type N-terminal cleavage/methylation domain-containing protein [Vibrio toranzoniae]NAZ70904.1 prepilin-type N-terminal cleavage/methylation domain-containing protein [Vibrio toranzoniae]NAZ93480.1 prepilin-type N-terminal cleavage/methylation domain-containing protein [Vibrio toranzoniae]NAZ96724.1 prepilin-type N-terminal cleavage/methylation domain-containing protein [Vibrio tora